MQRVDVIDKVHRVLYRLVVPRRPNELEVANWEDVVWLAFLLKYSYRFYCYKGFLSVLFSI